MIDERNMLLQQKDLGVHINTQLHDINTKLDALGLAYQSRDPDYDAYLRALHEFRSERQIPYSPDDLKKQDEFIRHFIEKLQ